MKSNEFKTEKNVFQQIADLFSGFFAAGEERKGTYYDDAARIIQRVIFVAAIVRIVSYTFANKVFLSWLGDPIDLYVAIGISLLLEVAIVFIGFAFAKGIARRESWYNLLPFFIVVFLGITFGFALTWGYRLSTDGQKEIAIIFSDDEKAAQKVTQNKDLANLENQLQQNTDEKQKGLNHTYRKKITWEGTVIARNAQKNEGELLKQKTMLLAAELKKDSIKTAGDNFKKESKAKWTGVFGGYMEIISLFSILALGFCSVQIEKLDSENEVLPEVITSNYQITNGFIVIDGKKYDKTQARQWLTNCVARSQDKSKTPEQREYFKKRCEQIGEAITEYEKAYGGGVRV